MNNTIFTWTFNYNKHVSCVQFNYIICTGHANFTCPIAITSENKYRTSGYLKICKARGFFSVFLAFDFCRFCVVIHFFQPRHNGQWPPTLKDFYTRSYPLQYFHILILEKEPVFPFSMLSAIFTTSLVWRGPWLGIEPRISRTRCQHSTTRLSRRRCIS